MRDIYYFIRHPTQPAYRIKGIGLGRLCETVRLYAARKASATPLPKDDIRGPAKSNCYLRVHLDGQIFFLGSYFGDELTILTRLFKPDGVFIDAGAKLGKFSIAAAIVAKKSKVVACEPVVEYWQRLMVNVFLNGFDHVHVMPLAFGKVERALPIYDQQETFSDGTPHEGLTVPFSSNSRGAAREVAAVRRLYDVLEQIEVPRANVIKLDIAGTEWIALRGATNTLASVRPVLILEIGRETYQAADYEPETFAKRIIDQGYRIERSGEDGKTLVVTPAQLGDFQNVVAYPVA